MSLPAQRTLDDVERLAWLRLIRSENVGPITFRQLLSRFETAQRPLAALPDLAAKAGRRRSLRVYPQADAEAELTQLYGFGGRLLACCEAEFPPALAALDDAPPLLQCLGQASLGPRPAVAVVGARNASANGRRIAETLARDLAEAGLLVASGMARGIDSAAHRGAGAGATAAVLAGGVDVIYPPENDSLYGEIREAGLILAEMPFGTRPQARHFPRRNRIISGMSLATLVVEAAPRSGSLITARYALDQGREVMAVPGSPLDPRARGCNALIRQGAALVESAEDVLEVINPLLGSPKLEISKPAKAPPAPGELGESDIGTARDGLIELLGATPVTVDELIRRCQVSPAAATMALLELELAGRLERLPGNRVALLPG